MNEELKLIRELNELRRQKLTLEEELPERPDREPQADEPGRQTDFDVRFLKSCNIAPWDPGEN